MLDKYNFKKYVIEDNPDDFFKWCLEHKLYKTSQDKKFNSRMKLYFNHEIEFTGLTCIVAFLQHKPVGIILCEHQADFENATIYENTTVARSHFKIKEQFDWGLQHIGMINMYIKKNNRKQGLAKTMFQQLEQLRLSCIAKENFEFNPLSVPVFQAKELACIIAEKYAQYAYVSPHKPRDYCYIYDMHDLSNFLVECRDNEPITKQLRLRHEFNQDHFANKSIDYATTFVLEENMNTRPKSTHKA